MGYYIVFVVGYSNYNNMVAHGCYVVVLDHNIILCLLWPTATIITWWPMVAMVWSWTTILYCVCCGPRPQQTQYNIVVQDHTIATMGHHVIIVAVGHNKHNIILWSKTTTKQPWATMLL